LGDCGVVWAIAKHNKHSALKKRSCMLKILTETTLLRYANNAYTKDAVTSKGTYKCIQAL